MPGPGHWEYRSRIGVFRIRCMADGRWHPMFDGRSLGSYGKPETALADLVGGHTFYAGPGIATDQLGLPAALDNWELVPGR